MNIWGFLKDSRYEDSLRRYEDSLRIADMRIPWGSTIWWFLKESRYEDSLRIRHMRIFLHGIAICCPRGGVAEASRTDCGASRRLAEPRSPRGELILLFCPANHMLLSNLPSKLLSKLLSNSSAEQIFLTICWANHDLLRKSLFEQICSAIAEQIFKFAEQIFSAI